MLRCWRSPTTTAPRLLTGPQQMVSRVSARPDALVGGFGCATEARATSGRWPAIWSSTSSSSSATHGADSPGFAPTSNMGLRRDVFENIGGFDERFRKAAAEDRELCGRAHAAGYPLVVAPEAVVDHHHDLSFRGLLRQQAAYGRGEEHATGRSPKPADARRRSWLRGVSSRRSWRPASGAAVRSGIALLLRTMPSQVAFMAGTARLDHRGEAVTVRVAVTTIVRRSGLDVPSGWLRILDLDERRQLAMAPLPDPVHRARDTNPRGGMRGGRGIAATGDRIAIAINDRILVLDSSWRMQGVLSHRWLGGVHELEADEGGLWIACSRQRSGDRAGLGRQAARFLALAHRSPSSAHARVWLAARIRSLVRSPRSLWRWIASQHRSRQCGEV